MTSKEAQKRYNKSEKAKMRKFRYSHSDKGQATIRAWNKAHPNYWRDWNIAHPNYHVERYQRLQGEMGYHGDPNLSYPGYRFIKALETAEVVEIKPE